MNQHIDRALLLMQQSRNDLAEQELRQILVQEPANAFAHALLALCLIDSQRYGPATQEAQEAIFHQPDMPFAHYCLARVYEARNQLDAARAAIGEAIRLDPYDAPNFALLSQIELNARDWRKGLEAAETGLRIDAENAQCTNLRAIALVKLGRKAEAGLTLDSALSRDPEDAITHANMGWRLLHESKPRQAMEHFREALRIEPGLEWAQHGIVEAMKARNIIYRGLLAYFLWMSRLSGKAQMFIIVGLYFGVQFIDNLQANHPSLAPYLYPLVVLYTLFAVFTWIADPLFNLLLRFNKFGRLVLSRQATSVANVMAVGFGAAALTGIAYWCTGAYPWLLAAIYLFSMTVMSTFAMRAPAGWPRWILAAYCLGMAVVGGGVLAIAYIVGDGRLGPWGVPYHGLRAVYIYGFVGYVLASNGLGMVRVRR